jgi:hypothetical protein
MYFTRVLIDLLTHYLFSVDAKFVPYGFNTIRFFCINTYLTLRAPSVYLA